MEWSRPLRPVASARDRRMRELSRVLRAIPNVTTSHAPPVSSPAPAQRCRADRPLARRAGDLRTPSSSATTTRCIATSRSAASGQRARRRARLARRSPAPSTTVRASTARNARRPPVAARHRHQPDAPPLAHGAPPARGPARGLVRRRRAGRGAGRRGRRRPTCWWPCGASRATSARSLLLLRLGRPVLRADRPSPSTVPVGTVRSRLSRARAPHAPPPRRAGRRAASHHFRRQGSSRA